MSSIKVALRRDARNKTGKKKLHGPSIKSGTPSYFRFPDQRRQEREAGYDPNDVSDGLRALADWLDERPSFKRLVSRGKFDVL